MYCPKCSQKQISEDVRFCSRCGFQMEGVIRLLANDGILPFENKSETSFVRRAASTIGAKIIFSSVILFIITFLYAVADNAPAVLIVPFLLFLAGLAQMSYILIFGKKTSELDETENIKNFNPAKTNRNLPPILSEPVSAYQKIRRDEGELIPPPSVTEPTTKLFRSEGDTNDL